MPHDSDIGRSETFQDLLNARILEQLQPLKATGSFATSETCKEFVPPGISIVGLGSIPLPLSEEDAARLIAVSRKAPFGKGSQTLIDEEVRKTWEINSSQVSFQNPNWSEYLDKIVVAATRNLGVPTRPETITAELHKLLLYEEGAFFKPHKDTEKSPGMFATLVICLPSQHLGGTVSLQHGKKEYRFDTDKSSAFGLTYLCWYTDVTHSVELVQSGYRLVLSYNLICNPEGPPPSAMKLKNRLDDFLDILSDWQSEQAPTYACYALEHQYTHASLALKTLKGNDYVRVRHVSDACAESGYFCALLATMQRIETFPAYEHYEGDVKYKFSLSHIFDLNGFVVQESVQIKDDHVIQRDLYTDRTHDKQEGGEHLGNENADIDRFYNDTVLIVVPKTSAGEFLLGAKYDLQRFNRFITFLLENSHDPIFHMLMNQTCQAHLNSSSPDPSTTKGFMGSIALVAVALSDGNMFNTALDSSEDGFNDEVYYSLGTKLSPENPIIPKKVFAMAFSSKQLHERWRRFRKYIAGRSPGNCADDISHAEAWIKDEMSKALQILQEITWSDAAALIEMFETYGVTFFESSIKPTIIRFNDDIAFVHAVMVQTLRSHDTLADDADRFIALVLDVVFSNFDLNYFSSEERYLNDFPWSTYHQSTDDVELMVSFYKELAKSGKPSRANRFLKNLQSQFEKLEKPHLDALIIPLLKCFCTVIDMASPSTKDFCENLLRTYCLHSIGLEPEKPSDWLRPEVKCYGECSLCESLNNFLRDPEEKERRFEVSDGRMPILDDRFLFGCGYPPPFTQSHLRSQTKYCKVSEIRKDGDSRYVLVEKTFDSYEKEKDKWTERAEKGEQQINSLPINLQACLGDNWVGIMNLECLRASIT